jgi:hypothetical protein
MHSYWRWRSWPRAGRPRVCEEIRSFVRQMGQGGPIVAITVAAASFIFATEPPSSPSDFDCSLNLTRRRLCGSNDSKAWNRRAGGVECLQIIQIGWSKVCGFLAKFGTANQTSASRRWF